MKTLSPREELIQTLSGEHIGCFPRSIPVFTPILDMMEKTGSFFPKANYDASAMATLALSAHKLGRWNSVMLPWASTVEMEAMGCEVVNREDDVTGYPQFKNKAFSDAYDVTLPDDILQRGSFPAVFEATELVRRSIDQDCDGSIPIVSMFQGPFTIASYIIGVNDMYKHVIRDEERARYVLDIVSDLNIRYGGEMLDRGGDVILMSDPAAEGLTGEQFKKLLLPVYRKITESLRGRKMVHICGKTGRIALHLPETGFHGFSFDSTGVEIEQLRETVGGRIKLIGSVSTVSHLLEGSREDVLQQSQDMIHRGVDILSPSCGLPQFSPLENVRAMADAIETWNNKRGKKG
jgi:[methyl-Co(III) methanol-specific corrinoid protein]:coenzyme M methyltransferase